MVPQGMSFVANTEGQPIGRSASLGKRSGGSPLRIETAAFLHSRMPNQSGLWRPFEADGTARCGDRHVRHPPSFCWPRKYRSKRGSWKPSHHLRG